LSVHFQSTIFSLNFQSEILPSIIERVSAFIECEPLVRRYRQATGSVHFKIAFLACVKQAIGPGSSVAATALKDTGPYKPHSISLSDL
jgi:hypothetical protein